MVEHGSSPLEAAIAVARGEPHRFSGVVPDGWQQGRGAFGGLVIGMMTRAVSALDVAAGRELRSLNVERVGPVRPGAVAITVEPLRTGSGVSSVAARVLQHDQVQAHAVAVFGKRRVEDGDWVDLEPAVLAPWTDTAVLAIGPPFGPAFASHFELRPTGLMPFSEAAPRASGWVRPRVPPARYDDALLAALADAWWPATFGRLSAPRPAATLTYSLQILADAASLAPDVPLHHAGHAAAARDGYTVELRELRTPEGRLVALNQQTIALIR